MERIDVENNTLTNPGQCRFHTAVNKLNAYKMYIRLNKTYTEYKQNKALKELDAGIDLGRFEADEEYKHDTIIGLSLDLKTFELACSLAKFYAFDIWKVYMTFTEFLLTESDVELKEAEAKLNPLTEVLREKKQDFKKAMDEKVLPLIDGGDLERLIVFYNLLGKLIG